MKNNNIKPLSWYQYRKVCGSGAGYFNGSIKQASFVWNKMIQSEISVG